MKMYQSLTSFGRGLSSLVRNPVKTGLVLFLLSPGYVWETNSENPSTKSLARTVAQKLLNLGSSLNGTYGLSLLGNNYFGGSDMEGIDEVTVNFQDLNGDHKVGDEDNLVVKIVGLGSYIDENTLLRYFKLREVRMYDNGIDGELDSQIFLMDKKIVNYLEFDKLNRYRNALMFFNDNFDRR